ncbi:methyltransferase MtaB domain-containing protein [Desulfosporosinus youngiae]|uniref:Methanol-cobalamin methyltransferase B subunit n=1 Tax=Desulfosporosinus youngiae DSM 17734 TaxID=768710 RepID=H5Y442_9FIRM|nr:methyltransferase MtaB domain-containing protein [Desulfosporosinus youngiae]EHQ89723.1 Methanol-cobalamin methyltransferase B subunit [Desulfosporosinus youngiae DSM 17734]
MANLQFTELAYTNLDEFVYGHAKNPVVCNNGMVIGGGTVYPEVNLTLPTMLISEETMPKVLAQYEEMIHGICSKAHELLAPGILIEIELLPPCTFNPQWGIDVTKVVKGVMDEYNTKFGLKSLLRMTVVDVREGKTLTHMYKGEHWDNVIDTFKGCAEAGADFLAIESIGGKHLHDEAVMNVDLPRAVFSLGVVGCRDMEILWDEIVKIAADANCIPSGDTACGFANTSMVMAHKNFIPKVFAAIDRVMCAVRTLVAVERGAQGPDKDCGYEGVYLKAITGRPISMEGKTAACAHSSHVGNIAACLADCWSNESVENVRLLGGMAPTVCTEQLIYDCRIMNGAASRGFALQMRDILSESDRMYDPQAYILDPAVVLKISQEIVKGKTHFERTKIAAAATINELRSAFKDGLLQLDAKELKYLDIFEKQLKSIPDNEAEFSEFMIKNSTLDKFDPAKYDFNADSAAK